ncbi:MAG: response regulator transcription factor [Bacteroidota bacterium]|nr:response regulator transcription factor [Bacteroidota bacterium]
MMATVSDLPITTVLVDDNPEFIYDLKERLMFVPDVQVVGVASSYQKAKKLILTHKPDLLFLDVEMPFRSGFDLLEEIRSAGCTETKVIFYTAYDHYMIDALRKSVFDFIVKPVRDEELLEAISRFRENRLKKTTEATVAQEVIRSFPDAIALPTSVGFKFVDRNRIVLFSSFKDNQSVTFWEALLSDDEHVLLPRNVNAKEISRNMNSDRFIQINQSAIVNINFINLIEVKSKTCILTPPFHKIPLAISRSYYPQIRDRFNLF